MLSFSTFHLRVSKLNQALKLIVLNGIILINHPGFSQGILDMKQGRETAIMAGLAAHSLVNLKIASGRQQNAIQYRKIRGLDKAAPHFFSPRYARTSDITFTSAGLPAADRKPAITLGLSALAIGTGVLRIKAGKHFPTDVLAGAILGTGVAYLNTRWHAQ
jgi:hypothetical protein